MSVFHEQTATIDRVVWGRDRDGVYSDRLATQYYLEAALEPGCWHVVASSLGQSEFGKYHLMVIQSKGPPGK